MIDYRSKRVGSEFANSDEVEGIVVNLVHEILEEIGLTNLDRFSVFAEG